MGMWEECYDLLNIKTSADNHTYNNRYVVALAYCQENNL